jgi:carboxyl-terminal processing protease
MSLLREVHGLLEERGLGGEPAEVEQALLEAMLRIADPNARVWSAAELEEHRLALRGYRCTPGVLVEPGTPHPRAAGALPGSAAEGHVQAGDAIVTVNGAPMEHRHPAAVYQRLHRDGDAPVELALRRAEETVSVKLDRAWQQMPAVESVELLPRPIAYTSLRGFYGDGEALREGLTAFSEAQPIGRIIDLRRAAGDALDLVDQALNLLQKRHDLLYTLETRNNGERRVSERTGDGLLREPVMILIGPETRGAAEVFAAAATRCRQVLLIGAATRGDMLVREAVPLSTGDWLYVASRTLAAGETTYLGDKGVDPDIAVSSQEYVSWSPENSSGLLRQRQTAAGEEENRLLRQRVGDDAVLQRAVDLLLGLEALRLH